MLVMYTWYGKMFPKNAVFSASKNKIGFIIEIFSHVAYYIHNKKFIQKKCKRSKQNRQVVTESFNAHLLHALRLPLKFKVMLIK